MKNVLISGCNGFLGRHLVARFLEQGTSVRGIGTAPSSKTPEISYRQIDLTKPITDQTLFHSVDIAIHAAAILPLQGRDPSLNPMLTKNFVEGFANTPPTQFVHVSSASVYGSRSGERREDDDLTPDTAYGQSKLDCERIVERATAQGTLRHACIVRPANVFGPGMAPSNNLLRLGNLIRRRRFFGLGIGDNRKSLLHIDDAVDACLLAAEVQSGLQTFNVSTGNLKMRQITDAIAGGLGSPKPLWISRVSPNAVSSALQKAPIGSFAHAGRSISAFGSSDVLDDQRIRSIGFKPESDLVERLVQTFSGESSAN